MDAGLWSMVDGLETGLWLMACGLWLMVHGSRFMVMVYCFMGLLVYECMDL